MCGAGGDSGCKVEAGIKQRAEEEEGPDSTTNLI